MRRLTAILAADVVGFSRLMGQDEVATLAHLKALRVQVLEPLIAEHRGRVVKLMGDGLLVEFASVVDAITCAVAWQERVPQWAAQIDEDARFQFRIGINVGDVIVEGDDLYGDGVNIATRLEAQAAPGGICLSEDAYRQVKGKVQVAFEDLGPRHLKNIAGAVRIYHVQLGVEPGATVSIAHRSHDKPSIAVLPFVNLSGDEHDYFSDGITEDLITELSRFRSLFVIAGSSSFHYKHHVPMIQEVGRQLGAEYVVQGSVRKAGRRVRITAQLVQADTGHHVWAERYDRDMEDLFELQDEVVRRITGTLVGRLEEARNTLAQRQTRSDLKAYDIYLRARQHFFNLSLEDNQKAAELLEATIGIDPDHAAALALLSEVYLRAWLNGWNDSLESDLTEAYRIALKAIEIDEEDSRTHTALGLVCLYRRERDRPRYHFETALRLNPNDARVLVFYSRHATFNGDPDLALDLANRALQLNPFGKYSLNLGFTAFVAEQYDLAVDQLSSVRNPPVAVLAMLAASLAMLDRMDEARATSERLLEVAQAAPALPGREDIGAWRRFFVTRWPFRKPEDRDRFLTALQKAGLPL